MMGMGMMNSGMGMGQGMMNSGMGMGGQGMTGGMAGSGMATGQQMGSMAGMYSGSLLGSTFSFLLNGLLILAVIALFVGLIGFGYFYIKKNFQTKSGTTKVEVKEEKIESPKIITNP